MNRLTRTLTSGLICSLLLAACTPPTPVLNPTVSAPPIPATATVLPPTRTPLPTASPTPQPVNETVTIQPCAEDGTGDTVNFNELIESLTPTLTGMDSYRYHTLYRYLEAGRYADGELSVDVQGAQDGLLSSPVESIFPLISQNYERTKVVLNDLRNGSRTETIVTGDGFWVREGDKPGWVAFDPATPADLVNLAEMFSPPLEFLFMFGGGGNAPMVRAETPAMMRTETLDGREVTHRCWILAKNEGFDINATLVHARDTYTFISDAQVHLWTTKDDKQLVRLALTGKHILERQGFYDDAEKDIVRHDPPRDFLLWT